MFKLMLVEIVTGKSIVCRIGDTLFCTNSTDIVYTLFMVRESLIFFNKTTTSYEGTVARALAVRTGVLVIV